MAIKLLGLLLIISMMTIKVSTTPHLQSTAKSWSDAVTTCQGLGMKLYTVETLQKYNDLTSYLASTGLSFGTDKAPFDVIWLGGDYSSTDSFWNWDSPNLRVNRPGGYTNWKSWMLPNAANDVDPGSWRCLVMQVNQYGYTEWWKYPCWFTKRFVCEPPTPSISLQPTCLSLQSWPQSWANAVIACQGLGMKLYTIETQQKFDALTSYLASTGLGFGTNGSPYANIWIGGEYNSTQSCWEWDSPNIRINRQGGYTNWRSYNLPDAANDVDPGYYRCLLMQVNYIDYMGWAKYPCGFARRFVCEPV